MDSLNRKSPTIRMSAKVLDVILSHQAPGELTATLAHWERTLGESNPLVAFGGPETAYTQLDPSRVIWVSDPELRTHDHQREKQSYAGVWRAVATRLRETDSTHIYFAEYDHLPLVADLHERLLSHLASEQADVLGHHLLRTDDTNNVHYLFHSSDPAFLPALASISVRKNRSLVLNMLGTGSFWTREAFLAVAEQVLPARVYLEIHLPTVAHHLGFRVRNYPGDQDRFVLPTGNMETRIAEARQAGAWTIHPVKSRQDRCRQGC